MSLAVIYVAGYETDDDHSTTAGYIAGKVKKKTKYEYGKDKVPILNGPSELGAYLGGPNGRQVVKIYVVSHGNQQVIEGQNSKKDLSAQQLANILWSRGLKALAAKSSTGINTSIKITIVTCMSGSTFNDQQGRPTSYAGQVASYFKEWAKGMNCRQIVITGMAGFSFTTKDGHNRVYRGPMEHTRLNVFLKNALGVFEDLAMEARRDVAPAKSQVAKPRTEVFPNHHV